MSFHKKRWELPFPSSYGRKQVGGKEIKTGWSSPSGNRPEPAVASPCHPWRPPGKTTGTGGKKAEGCKQSRKKWECDEKDPFKSTLGEVEILHQGGCVRSKSIFLNFFLILPSHQLFEVSRSFWMRELRAQIVKLFFYRSACLRWKDNKNNNVGEEEPTEKRKAVILASFSVLARGSLYRCAKVLLPAPIGKGLILERIHATITV